LTGALPDYVREHEQNGKKADRIGDLWQHYLGDARLPLYGFTFSGVWGDTNNVQTYIDTNKLAMNSLSSRGRVVLGKNVTVDKDATLIGPVVIDDHAVIGRAVIGPYTHVMHHARIDDGAIVTGSILFERAHVKKNARVEDAVVDGLAVIEENARLDAYTLVGYKAHVGKGARVLNRSKIWPGVTLSEGAVVEGDVETDVTVALQKELDESRFWK
jgi:NDP-sugar pyrophosphorylase family protein